MGSGRTTGMSHMEEMRPSPSVGRGMPPWTQNTWQKCVVERVGGDEREE